MRQIKKNQGGFTLIELVVVIVILGILAATAIPKFVDLSTEAGNAAASGVAGAIASGSAANYAAKLAGKGGKTIDGANNVVCTGDNIKGIISGVELVATPDKVTDGNKYYISGGTGDCSKKDTDGTTEIGVGAGGAITCKVKGIKGDPQTATLICTGA